MPIPRLYLQRKFARRDHETGPPPELRIDLFDLCHLDGVTGSRGDSLSSIAERELGAPAYWKEIFHVSRAQLSDPDEIVVGMELVLPKPKKSTATATSRAPDHQDRRPEAPDQKDRDTAGPNKSSASPRQPAPESSGTSSQPSALPSPSSDGSHQAPTTTVPTVEVSPLSLAGAGALLATGVIGGLAWRRRVQLQTRPQGRRIVHAPPPTREVEVALGQRQRPMSLRTLDRAMRALAAHCKEADVAPPPLQLALVGDGPIELRDAAALLMRSGRLYRAWPLLVHRAGRRGVPQIGAWTEPGGAPVASSGHLGP